MATDARAAVPRLAIQQHGGRRHRRCGVGGGGIAHGRPRVRREKEPPGYAPAGSFASDFLTRLVRICPGPVSTNPSTPRASSARTESLEPAHRLGQSADELPRNVVLEGLRRDARHHRHVRLGELDALDDGP